MPDLEAYIGKLKSSYAEIPPQSPEVVITSRRLAFKQDGSGGSFDLFTEQNHGIRERVVGNFSVNGNTNISLSGGEGVVHIKISDEGSEAWFDPSARVIMGAVPFARAYSFLNVGIVDIESMKSVNGLSGEPQIYARLKVGNILKGLLGR